MKRSEEIKDWMERYQRALCAYLEGGASADIKPAAQLGTEAVALGLETLDVAKLHVRVLRLMPPLSSSEKAREKMIARTEVFFAELLVPIERTHPATQQAEGQVKESIQTLHEYKKEKVALEQKLTQGITRRKSADAALRDSGVERTLLLRESRKLHQRMRYRLRKLLLLQENVRLKDSRHIRDELAQMLVALDLRLLELQTIGKANLSRVSNLVAKTRRMVKDSNSSLRQLPNARKKPKDS